MKQQQVKDMLRKKAGLTIKQTNLVFLALSQIIKNQLETNDKAVVPNVGSINKKKTKTKRYMFKDKEVKDTTIITYNFKPYKKIKK